jgi:hypothetical protein
MEFLWNLSDDELALVGCCGALIVSFGLISGAYHLRRIIRSGQLETDGIDTHNTSSADPGAERSTERRAA